jgi:hypothetical protein
VRWLDANGVEQHGYLLFASATVLYFDATLASPPPNGATLIIGAQRPRWKSKAFDAGVSYAMKRSYYLDVTRTVKESGSLLVNSSKDFKAQKVDRDKSISLTKGFGHIPVQVKGDFIDVEFTEPFAAAGTRFELTDLVLRLDQTDPH